MNAHEVVKHFEQLHNDFTKNNPGHCASAKAIISILRIRSVTSRLPTFDLRENNINHLCIIANVIKDLMYVYHQNTDIQDQSELDYLLYEEGARVLMANYGMSIKPLTELLDAEKLCADILSNTFNLDNHRDIMDKVFGDIIHKDSV